MSWPVPNTLMIEPTESESREELDRFVEALVSIRGEIREVEEGLVPREGNVLKMAPHSIADVVEGDKGGWERCYGRERAAFPLPWLREKKFWPSVARVDDGEFTPFGAFYPFIWRWGWGWVGEWEWKGLEGTVLTCVAYGDMNLFCTCPPVDDMV